MHVRNDPKILTPDTLQVDGWDGLDKHSVSEDSCARPLDAL